MNGTESPTLYLSHSLVEGGAACRSGMAVLSAKVEVVAAGECEDKKSPTASLPLFCLSRRGDSGPKLRRVDKVVRWEVWTTLRTLACPQALTLTTLHDEPGSNMSPEEQGSGLTAES